jgi:hypothetical protein
MFFPELDVIESTSWANIEANVAILYACLPIFRRPLAMVFRGSSPLWEITQLQRWGPRTTRLGTLKQIEANGRLIAQRGVELRTTLPS